LDTVEDAAIQIATILIPGPADDWFAEAGRMNAAGRMSAAKQAIRVVGMVAPQKLAAALSDTSKFARVTLRPGIGKAGQVAGAMMHMKDPELELATKLLKKGAQVFRSHQAINVGDFVVIHRGKVFAVELGTAGKTRKQLKAAESILGRGFTPVAGTAQTILDEILGKT
jgi:hypothetical protein